MLWTNMGHIILPSDVDMCRERCTFNGVPPKVVITIREPYSFWKSLYSFAWTEPGAQVPFSAIRVETSAPWLS